MKAVLDGVVVAESDETVVVEGNHYFPAESIRAEFFAPADRRTTCAWKGEASYYDVTVGGRTVSGAAWYYPEPKAAASAIEGHVAFYRHLVDVTA